MSSTISTPVATATIEKKHVKEGSNSFHRSVVQVRLTAEDAAFKDDETLVYLKGKKSTALGVPHLLRQCTTLPSVTTPPSISDDGRELTVTYDAAVVPEYQRHQHPREESEVAAARLVNRVQALYDDAKAGR